MHRRNLPCRRVLVHLFLKHIVCLCHLSGVMPCTSSSIFRSFGLFVRILPLSSLRMVQSILQRECTGVDSFDKISTAEFDFEKFSHSSFFSSLFDRVSFQYSQVLLIVFLFQCSDAFQRGHFRCFSFPFFIVWMAYFSTPNSIPTSWLYIRDVHVKVFNSFFGSVGWGCRIHLLHFCRGAILP